MTCQHPGCSFHIFSSCTNHCTKNVCLEHLIEHGDIFLQDFTNLLDRLDKSTCVLMKEVNNGMTQIIQRREYEIERINHIYDEEQQEIRKQLTFAETANNLLKDKQDQLIKSKQQNQCLIAQHDIEQIKSYTIQIKKSLHEKQIKPKPSNCFTNFETTNNSSKIYACPLIQPNVFGIKLEHNIRFDCDGLTLNKYNLSKHFENYHRMLPECALRLRDAIINGQRSDQTKLFSENEIILNQEFFVDCPLTDPTNIFGARSYIHTLIHIPCTRKQLTIPSMMNHFRIYHRMRFDVAKILFHEMKTKTLHSDLILFEPNQRLGTTFKKKNKIYLSFIVTYSFIIIIK